MENNCEGSRFIYFLAGLGIGALVGVLYAPQSGEETRELLAGKADESRDYVLRKSREIKDQATGYVERGKGIIAEQKEHLTAAVEAGKQAYPSGTQSPSK